MSAPDFYLACSEGYGLEEPRSCWRIKRVLGGQRDDFLMAKVEPPVPGGLAHGYINLVLLATRHVGVSLFPITKWPVSVYVCRICTSDPESRNSFLKREFELIAWAELYPTEQDARSKTNVPIPATEPINE